MCERDRESEKERKKERKKEREEEKKKDRGRFCWHELSSLNPVLHLCNQNDRWELLSHLHNRLHTHTHTHTGRKRERERGEAMFASVV